MTNKTLPYPAFNWKTAIQYGLIAGIAVLYVCLVGMVESFDKRDVIYKTLSLGRALLMIINLGMGYTLARKLSGAKVSLVIIGSIVVGLVSFAITAIFTLSAKSLDLRNILVNTSPALVKILTFNQSSFTTGLLILAGLFIGCSLLGTVIYLLPAHIRNMITVGLLGVLIMGMLQELLYVNILSQNKFLKPIADFIFGKKGLSIAGTAIILAIFSGLNGLWATQKGKYRQTVATLSPTKQRAYHWGVMAVALLLLLALPRMTGSYITQIAVLVGIYTLMGLGLNIDIGLAGLLDLGFVGFFAIGAYTMALLTSTNDLGLANVITGQSGSLTSFWAAIPIAIGVSAFAGMFLGIPVLRMRGDYLAIVTMGFAEIIRILVLSDFLRPILGGAQGILNIPNPTLGAIAVKDPEQFYYLIIISCMIVAFIAWRVQSARLGRNWMAVREDEDVAEAMGINLTATKLLAFGIGASFAGLSGAIFATQLGSVFPHSFAMQVSINVLCLIIVGGMGNIPGVIVGALVLVGLPELLREFSEFRMLIYGALLVVMMLVKPEGLWPSEARRRELRTGESVEESSIASPGESAWEITETVSM